MAVLKVTSETFEEEVLQAEVSVLVDFYADWCGPCRMMSPMVEEISEEQPEIKVCKLNIDESHDIAELYGVMSIPTFIAFRNGAVKNRILGTKPKSALLALVR